MLNINLNVHLLVIKNNSCKVNNTTNITAQSQKYFSLYLIKCLPYKINVLNKSLYLNGGPYFEFSALWATQKTDKIWIQLHAK
jgi:hypothetical protein